MSARDSGNMNPASGLESIPVPSKYFTFGKLHFTVMLCTGSCPSFDKKKMLFTGLAGSNEPETPTDNFGKNVKIAANIPTTAAKTPTDSRRVFHIGVFVGCPDSLFNLRSLSSLRRCDLFFAMRMFRFYTSRLQSRRQRRGNSVNFADFSSKLEAWQSGAINTATATDHSAFRERTPWLPQVSQLPRAPQIPSLARPLCSIPMKEQAL